MSAFCAPSERISSRYFLSSKSFLISVEIGIILSTRTCDKLSLKSEKFLPENSLIESSKVDSVKLEYIPIKFLPQVFYLTRL